MSAGKKMVGNCAMKSWCCENRLKSSRLLSLNFNKEK